VIVRILSNGKSFAGAAAYLTHDPDAQTNERVAWTHTLNLANDHVPSAVDEMLWTARNAELLKQEAGIRAGGRATENPVKHLSLNWSPEDKPTREHMIATTEEFLRGMKWQEHQALLVAHSDKPYAHVHVMLNTVHPETGLRLADSYEKARAQEWAKGYELEQGRVYCAQRLMDPAQREDAPPRNVWVAFQENEKEFAQAEKILRQQEPILTNKAKIQKNAEWKIIKEIQQAERKGFFAEGKSEFSELRLSIYHEIREEFRDRWANFYAAKKDGADPEFLATSKAELIADQKAVLEERRDAACAELRESRDLRYRELLDDQCAIRADLRGRQEAGCDNALFLQELGDRHADNDMVSNFREAANEAALPRPASAWEANGSRSEPADSDARSHADVGVGIGGRLGAGFGSFLDSLFSDLVGEGPRPYRPGPEEANQLRAAADETVKREQRERDEADAEWRKRQRSPWD
jgi:hypothetical protein